MNKLLSIIKFLFGRTEWKCEACVNYGCVANDSICDDCDGENHFVYDEQEKVDDYRDRLDELEREEYYESKYGKEKE